MKRIVLTALVLAGLVLTAAPPAMTAAPAPVAKLKTTGFGNVLTRRDYRALYYWSVEKRAGGKVKCTGRCAKAWPPLIVRSRRAVPTRIAGIRGTFGTVRRPDGRIQVTRNRLPVYTYAHERPTQVLCDNVNGWFVVRLR